jgi:hypothetical protein
LLNITLRRDPSTFRNSDNIDAAVLIYQPGDFDQNGVFFPRGDVEIIHNCSDLTPPGEPNSENKRCIVTPRLLDSNGGWLFKLLALENGKIAW